MTGYSSERLFEQVAYVAYHFHWPYEQVMQMDHVERQRLWIRVKKATRFRCRKRHP